MFELQWFVVLAEDENVTVAAQRLAVSQPTLSRALSRLERRVGTRLFDRHSRGLRINHYGRIMLEHARRALAEMDTAEQRIAALVDPDAGRVRLAFLHSTGTWLVPDLLRRYRAEVPAVRFDLRQGTAEAINADLAAGHVDLLVTSPREPGVAWHPLHDESLYLAVPLEHRLAGRAQVRLAEVATEPFVVLGPESGLRHTTDELCRRAGFTPAVAFESAELTTARGLVGAGLGIAIVPPWRGDAGGPADVVDIPITDGGARRAIGLAWRDDQPQPPVVTRFIAFVRATGHEPAPRVEEPAARVGRAS